jgi:hypothetical protein
MRKITILAAFILIFVLLTGCKQGFKIIVNDSGNSVPTFKFKSAGIISISGVEIDSFNVFRFPGKSSDFLWRIESRDKKRHTVEEITYGVVPEGFNETKSPPQLVSGNHYVAGSWMPEKAGWVDFFLK